MMKLFVRSCSYLAQIAAAASLGVIGIGFTSVAAAAGKPPSVGAEAQDFELSALGGAKTKLSDLVVSGPVVLVVLRGYPGYQCPLCTKQFGDFLDKADSFKKAGAKVVFVYPGPSEKLRDRAAEFVKGKDYPDHFQILLDPDYTFTTAYGLRWDQKNETAYVPVHVRHRQQASSHIRSG
jgi:peroxiredoxin